VNDDRVLVDAGPLVALFSAKDRSHSPCAEAMQALRYAPLTCWPVVTEAAWLLRHRLDWLGALLSAIERGFIEICALDARDLGGVRECMKQYGSLSPQFADACLVHLAEREEIDTIFTLDRRDFSVYRTKRGKTFRLLPEIT
jgi:hypothetical protein